MARILVAEDDAILSQTVCAGLSELGYAVELATNGSDAEAFVRYHYFDLLILDWNLPGLSGLEVCRTFRKLGKVEPVLFLTSRSDVDDKVEAFSLGASDYLTKPFHVRELAARVKSLLRRPADYAAESLQIGEISLDLNTRALQREGNVIRLQPREMALLEFLVKRPGQVLGIPVLLSAVWGEEFDGSDMVLRSCVAKLRKALATLGHPDSIQTIHGFGYCFSLKS